MKANENEDEREGYFWRFHTVDHTAKKVERGKTSFLPLDTNFQSEEEKTFAKLNAQERDQFLHGFLI